MPPKVIWTYWQQGWEAAPELVKKCAESWRALNPEFEFRALDANSLSDFIEWPQEIDVRRADLTVQKISALGRLALLSRYGGVWVDATVFCRRPLREWIDDYASSGFFAYRNPGPDRLMSNWLIAADRDNVLLRRMYQAFTDYYAHNVFDNQGTRLGQRILEVYSGRWCVDVESTVNWHSRFAREVLRVYPYFIFHYTFNNLILNDPDCAELWRRVKPLAARQPHLLQFFANRPNGTELARQEIAAATSHVYKLDWRVDCASSYWSAVFDSLEEGR